MNENYRQTLDLMDKAFQDFESLIPSKPMLTNMSFGTAYRYKEKDIYQAIIQKLARAQSLIRGAQVLLNNGYLQEQAILHRTIDETNEDIIFLVYAVTNDKVTELHEQFLGNFWEEEIDESGNMIDSKQKRGMTPRKRIRAYIARIENPSTNPSQNIETSKTISKTYSGFVHGASPHIMDMYGGNPPRFYTDGMLHTPRFKEHSDDFWNYMYRTFLSHIAVAKAWGLEKHVETLNQHKTILKENEGSNY